MAKFIMLLMAAFVALLAVAAIAMVQALDLEAAKAHYIKQRLNNNKSAPQSRKECVYLQHEHECVSCCRVFSLGVKPDVYRCECQ